ncbi:MAG: TlpA disulfide reductase family protein, partial [Bacteroidota bacterium]
ITHMNKSAVYLLVSLAIVLTACSPEAPPEYTIVQGKLPAGTKSGKIKYDKTYEDLPVAEDGSYVDTINIAEEQYVDLALGDLRFWIYLSPGDAITISGDSVLSFSGDNAEINTYLYQSAMAEDGQMSFKEIYEQEEGDYLRYRDSIKADQLTHLAQLSAGNEAFQAFHRKGIEYDYLFQVAQYPTYHGYFVENYEPSATITSIYQEVSLDNEADAKRYSGYRYLASELLDLRADSVEDITTLSHLEASLSVLRSVQSPTILDEKLNELLYYFNAQEKNLESVRDSMLARAKLDDTKEAINERYTLLSKLKPGSPSPAFDYENYQGGSTKLADLKGKYVYVDIWATWCGPCLGEIPHLKKTEAVFHDANIEFVSISIDELADKDKWRGMIEKRELGGTQLFADNDWESEFVRSYGILGIPHFILLDDQGNIVSANVERPSDPDLEKRLKGLGL